MGRDAEDPAAEVAGAREIAALQAEVAAFSRGDSGAREQSG
jgi:hypothetical protein